MPSTRFITIEGKRLSSQHWHNFQAICIRIQNDWGYTDNSIVNLIEQIKSNPCYKITSVAWLFSYYRRNYEIAFPELTYEQHLVYAAIDVNRTLKGILNHTPSQEDTPDTENYYASH